MAGAMAKAGRTKCAELRNGPDKHEVEFVEFVQWTADSQLHAAKELASQLGMRVGLYLDVAVGVQSNGFDAWNEQGAISRHLAVGAPPDVLNTIGQDWGLAGFNAGEAPILADSVRASGGAPTAMTGDRPLLVPGIEAVRLHADGDVEIEPEPCRLASSLAACNWLSAVDCTNSTRPRACRAHWQLGAFRRVQLCHCFGHSRRRARGGRAPKPGGARAAPGTPLAVFELSKAARKPKPSRPPCPDRAHDRPYGAGRGRVGRGREPGLGALGL